MKEKSLLFSRYSPPYCAAHQLLAAFPVYGKGPESRSRLSARDGVHGLRGFCGRGGSTVAPNTCMMKLLGLSHVTEMEASARNFLGEWHDDSKC